MICSITYNTATTTRKNLCTVTQEGRRIKKKRKSKPSQTKYTRKVGGVSPLIVISLFIEVRNYCYRSAGVRAGAHTYRQQEGAREREREKAEHYAGVTHTN